MCISWRSSSFSLLAFRSYIRTFLHTDLKNHTFVTIKTETVTTQAKKAWKQNEYVLQYGHQFLMPHAKLIDSPPSLMMVHLTITVLTVLMTNCYQLWHFTGAILMPSSWLGALFGSELVICWAVYDGEITSDLGRFTTARTVTIGRRPSDPLPGTLSAVIHKWRWTPHTSSQLSSVPWHCHTIFVADTDSLRTTQRPHRPSYLAEDGWMDGQGLKAF